MAAMSLADVRFLPGSLGSYLCIWGAEPPVGSGHGGGAAGPTMMASCGGQRVGAYLHTLRVVLHLHSTALIFRRDPDSPVL